MSEARGAALYDSASTRALDRVAIDVLGIPGVELMRRAGAAAFVELRRRWPAAMRILVVCGTGNNGGDGFVVAGLAAAAGLEATVWLPGTPAGVGGDAARCLGALAGTAVRLNGEARDCAAADVIVDALFGTGLAREPAGAHAAAIVAMNAARAPVLSLDLPSGLHASSGAAPGAVVGADVTVTFIARKQGLATGAGPACAGEVVLATLGLPDSVYAGVPATARLTAYADVRAQFTPRLRTAHKGHFGHVLVIGGAPGFSGAARMAAEAAARCGAGLVSVATHPAHAALLGATRPELMCHAVTDAASLRALAARASVVALGPGLGQSQWARELFAAARELPLAMVMDADALNLLAQDADHCETRILTPHAGEAARLAGLLTAAIEFDRFAAAKRLADTYGGVVVLKGAGTVVQSAGELPVIVGGGNPGMASGGMGDVLTGVIAGLLAQGWTLADAAITGACVHAEAADRAAVDGERGLLAGDLMPQLRAAVNPPRVG